MINLIMLCGQGSCGKSYYAIHNYHKDEIVRMDDVVKECEDYTFDYDKHFHIYIKKIQEKIDNNQKNIVLDFSQDSKKSRKHVLNQLKFNPNEIDFQAINFNVNLAQMILFHTKRTKQTLDNEKILRMQKIKNGFQPATVNEFKNYNFNSIKIYEYKI